MKSLSSCQSVRRGSAYILVLGIAMLISAVGVATITVSRIHMRASEGYNNSRQATMLAVSALEFGVQRVHAEIEAEGDNWRNTWANNVWETPVDVETGRIRWRVRDDVDADLTDSVSEAVVVEGQGQINNVDRFMSAEIVFDPYTDESAIGCLNHVIVAQDLTLQANSDLNGTGNAHANGTAEATTASCSLNVSAVGRVNGSTYSGTTTEAAAAVALPASSIVSQYQAMGTEIPLSALSKRGLQFYLENTLLTPNHNAFGATNELGIYWIDCENNNVNIQDVRIVGTLILLRAGEQSLVSGAVCWEPAVFNYPALLVEGNMNFQFRMSKFNENDIGVNLNPRGAPFKGTTDETVGSTDDYPSVIRGIVFSTADVCVYMGVDGARFEGHLICAGNLKLVMNSTAQFHAVDTFRKFPPPGFTIVTDKGYRPRIVEGSIDYSR